MLGTFIKRAKARAWEGLQGRLPWNARASYSQFGEDGVLDWLTREWKPGFFVDIGAYHPVALSNTYALYLKGWRGINIEARPEVRQEFDIFRPRDINVSCCIGPEPKSNATLFIFTDPAFTTLDEPTANATIAQGVTLQRKLPVQVVTINAVLNRWKPADVGIDLLSIDIEGLDEAILRTLDLSRFAPRLVVFEAHGTAIDNVSDNSSVRYMQGHGYDLVTLCGPSVIMRRTV